MGRTSVKQFYIVKNIAMTNRKFSWWNKDGMDKQWHRLSEKFRTGLELHPSTPSPLHLSLQAAHIILFVLNQFEGGPEFVGSDILSLSNVLITCLIAWGCYSLGYVTIMDWWNWLGQACGIKYEWSRKCDSDVRWSVFWQRCSKLSFRFIVPEPKLGSILIIQTSTWYEVVTHSISSSLEGSLMMWSSGQRVNQWWSHLLVIILTK